MANVIEKIEALHQRLERAREIVAEGRVQAVLGMDEHYVIQSSTGQGYYMVNDSCTCPDARERSELTKGLCKHRLAALLYQESQAEDMKTEDTKQAA